MRSSTQQTGSLGLKIAAGAGLLFLHLPILLIFVYAFTTEERSYQWPPPGFTAKWLAVTWNRPDIWDALALSLKVASVSTLIALLLGTLCAAAVSRSKFFGRETISLLVILPIALPGIVTGIALRSAFNLSDIPFSTWTIILGHATFCVVVVYNNAVARFRRSSASLIEASMDLGAPPHRTFRNVILPLAFPGVVAGSIFTFSLTLGDYIIPQIIGSSRLFIGQAVYSHQGTAGNIPLAAAFAVVPIVIMGFYLWMAKRAGAFDAL